jgi:multicomponent Na+:H+ antiporter subunit F
MIGWKHFISEIAAFILLTLIIGGVRIALGPTKADQILVVQFFGTSGVAICLLIAHGLPAPGLRDLALILVALAAVGTGAFTRVYSKPKTRGS